MTGERRWRAAKRTSIQTLPCLVFPRLELADRLLMQLRENLIREDLNVFERGRALSCLKSETPRLVTGRGVQPNQDRRYPLHVHREASVQPSPGVHRTAVPAERSTSSVMSSWGRWSAHSEIPSSATSSVAG